MAIKRVGRTVILVRDLSEAYAWYTETLGFTTIFNNGQFIHVGPADHQKVGVWLLQAESEEQRALVGRQNGGAPVMVLYTDDCRSTYQDLSARGVRFASEPRETSDDAVVHFYDLYGNHFVLVELKDGTLPR